MATITERKSPEGKKSYRVRIRLKGCPIQTATFSRKTDAKKWAQDTESAIREGRHFKIREAKKHTLTELINRYIEHIFKPRKLSRQERFTHLEWWKKSLGCYLLSMRKIVLLLQGLLKMLSMRVKSNSMILRQLESI